MRKALLWFACVQALSFRGAGLDRLEADANPFFADYGTPFNVHPFDRIEPEHFLPAFEEGMARQNAEVEAIVADPEPPTFDKMMDGWVGWVPRTHLHSCGARDPRFHFTNETSPEFGNLIRESPRFSDNRPPSPTPL